MARSSDEVPSLGLQLQSLRRVALAAARPSGPSLIADLMRELAEALDVAAVNAWVFEDEDRTRLCTLAAQLDGRPLEPFSLPTNAFSTASVRIQEFRHEDECAAPIGAEEIFGAAGTHACASYPLLDSGGGVLGLVAVMDRRSIAGGDTGHIEAF